MPIVRIVRTVDVPGYPAARFKAFDLDAGRTGPVVTIAAGMGGTAYPGIEACWRLISTLEQVTFNGRVTILPVLDTTGFMNRKAHFCALDDTALSTALSSMRLGVAGVRASASVAIAQAVQEALGTPDLHIDLRGGEVHEQHAYSVTALPADGTSASSVTRAAEASNATFRVAVDRMEPPPVEPGCAGAMRASGIPSLAITTGGIGFELEADAKILEYSSSCILKELGVLDWESTARPTPPHLVGPRWWTHTASHTGLWMPLVSAGARVVQGQVLGRICDYFGSELETVVAPFDGWVLTLLTTLAVDATPRADNDTWYSRTLTVVGDSAGPGSAAA
jgi:predicted deacylase